MEELVSALPNGPPLSPSNVQSDPVLLNQMENPPLLDQRPCRNPASEAAGEASAADCSPGLKLLPLPGPSFSPNSSGSVLSPPVEDDIKDPSTAVDSDALKLSSSLPFPISSFFSLGSSPSKRPDTCPPSPESLETSMASSWFSSLRGATLPSPAVPRGRDPIRLSRFMSFPSSGQPAVVTLFDGLISRNVHEIKILRPGYYGIRLHNLTEGAWDSLYLGMRRMKAVAEFEVFRPSSMNNKQGTKSEPSSMHRQNSDSGNLLNSKDGKCMARGEAIRSHLGNLSASAKLNIPSNGCLSNLPLHTDGDSAGNILGATASLVDPVAGSGIDTQADANGLLQMAEQSVKRHNSGSSSDADSSDLGECKVGGFTTDAISVLSEKGSLACKSQQENVIYFFVPCANSHLKLQVFASSTLGMRLHCCYDLMYCGTPRAFPSTPHMSNARILCLDGGGVLGISSLKILERLELEIQKQLKDSSVRLIDCFDMICGTSTGGIIALGLLSSLSIKEMIGQWGNITNRVFEGNRNLFSGVMFGGYDVSHLKDALVSSLGIRFMDTYSRPKSPYCFVTSTDVKHNQFELFLLRNYSHTHLANHEYRGGSSVPLWLAAWATASAPTYLRGPNPEELEKMGFIVHPEVQLCDGALKSNNPSMVALEEFARLSGKKLKHFIETDLELLVSVGTGQPTLKMTGERPGTVSTFQILLNAGHLLTSSRNVHREVLHWLGESEGKYFRFNVPGIGDIALDTTDKASYDLIVKATNDYLIDEKYYEVKHLTKQLVNVLRVK